MDCKDQDASMLLSLPNEVLELILRFDEIDHSSLCQLSLVCRRLKLLVSESKLWNLKAKHRWRVWRCAERRVRIASYDVLELPGVVEWKKLFIERHNCEKRVRNLLDEAAASYVYLDKDNGLIDDSCLLCVKSLLNEHDFIMETLREIIDGTSLELNLSHQFYAPSAYSFIKWEQLKDSFTFLFESDMNSSMELMTPIAIWIDQWMNPLEDLEYFDYFGEFDRLAERVKQGLSEDASQKDVISNINKVMFQEEGYHVNNNFYVHANSYLHNVIRSKKGIYVSLAVIFQAVASRVGLRLFPVCFPGYFVLTYQETDISGTSRKQFLTFVEGDRVRNMSQMELQPATSLFNEEVLKKLSTLRIVASRMLANIFITLINSLPNSQIDENVHFLKCLEVFELFADIYDERIKEAYNLAKVNLNYNLEEGPYLDASERFSTLLKERQSLAEKIERKKKESCIHQDFPIGLIVRLLVGSVLCFGVIFDRETVSNPENSSQSSISTLYHLLIDGDRFSKCDGSKIFPYLTQNEARPVSHHLIGKYFSHFNGSYYQPISLLQQLYSDDEGRIKSFISVI